MLNSYSNWVLLNHVKILMLGRIPWVWFLVLSTSQPNNAFPLKGAYPSFLPPWIEYPPPSNRSPGRGNDIQEKTHKVSAHAPVHGADENIVPVFYQYSWSLNLSSPMGGRFLGMHPTWFFLLFLILFNKCQGHFITPHN